MKRGSVFGRVSALTIVASLLAGLLSGCGGAPQTQVTPTVTVPAVRVATVERGRVVSTLTYPGNVQARSQLAITPEVAGRVKRLAVDVGTEVKAGQVLVEIDPSAYQLQLAQAEAALAVAQAKVATMEAGARPEQIALAGANLQAAQERLLGLEAGGRAELVAQAEANLAAAEARLDQARKGATPEQIAQAEANVRLAHNNEYYQQQQAEAIGSVLGAIPGDPVDRNELKRSQLGIAWEQSKLAEAKLAEVKAGATAEQLEQLGAAVEAARQQLAMAKNPYSVHDLGQAQAAVSAAEQQMALAQKPFTANELNAARAGIDQARAAVDLAKLQLQKAVVTSPVDGVIAQRLSSEGAMAAPTAPLVTMVTRDVEVTVNVEEARLGRVKLGQAATITVVAYPGETFPAQVAAISPSVDPRSRTVAVKVRPQPSTRLLDGMFAQVSIVADEQVQALRAPASAVVERDGKRLAYVVQDGFARARAVKVGLTDGSKVEIIEGLSEGDEVVAQGGDVVADGQAVRPQR